MKNIKLTKNLVGEHWRHGSAIQLAADDHAEKLPSGLNQEDKEKIIQSWKSIAVIEVEEGQTVYLGFISGQNFQILDVPLELESQKFGVRVGSEATTILVLPSVQNLPHNVSAHLLEITDENNPNYENLPIY